jgi:ketosteroid isomerase-like protein
MKTHDLIKTYYDRFNTKDIEGFLSLLTDDIIHEVSQGESQQSKETFRTSCIT